MSQILKSIVRTMIQKAQKPSIPKMVEQYFDLNERGDRASDDDAHAFYTRCGRIEKQIAETLATCDARRRRENPVV